MRPIGDHHGFRWHQRPRSQDAAAPVPAQDPTWSRGTPAPGDRWTAPDFAVGSLEAADPERFAAPLG